MSICYVTNIVYFNVKTRFLFPFQRDNDNDVDMVQEYDRHYGFLTSNTFYYTVKYKTITKHFYSQMYKIQDYITYFGYKQKIFVQSSLIQYKNMNVSYKLLHFAAAVH